MAWKTADGIKDASRFKPQLEVLLSGMLNPATFLDLVRNFIVFEKTKEKISKPVLHKFSRKKLAADHQYYAVNKAVESTIKAAAHDGTKKGGVVWHTQGSGKSLSMVFYAGKLVTSAAMQNPTLVVLTDRNDLYDQLFETFAAWEIAEKIRSNATIDWTIRESARAKLMVLVRRTLSKYGYPPDKQPKAIDTVLKQAELMADYWVSSSFGL